MARRRKKKDDEIQFKNVAVGGAFMGAVLSAVLMFGGRHDTKPEQPETEPSEITIVDATARRSPPPEIIVLPAEEEPAEEAIGETEIPSAEENVPVTSASTEVKTEIPAQAAPKARTNNSPLPEFVSENADGSKMFRVNGVYGLVKITKATMAAFEEVEREFRMPVAQQIAACARESRCDPTAVNPGRTKACGLFQLMPTPDVQTLFRVAYNYGPKHGYGAQQKWVTRYNVAGNYANGTPKPAEYHFKPKDEASRVKLMTLCLEPRFNALMHAEEKAWEIPAYEAWLGNRKITVGEAVLLNNLGVDGLKAFAQQAWDDKKNGTTTMARDHFSASTARQNPTLIKYDDVVYYETDKQGKRHKRVIIGEDKTVRQSFNDIINGFGGWKTPDAVLTASLQ